MLARTQSFCIRGAKAANVTVEVDIRSGLPAFSIVGLPDTAVRESRERVRAAILNDGFEFPQRRITINVAGGGEPFRSGPSLDLPIAFAILKASNQLENTDIEKIATVGELSLDGAVQPIRGSLLIAKQAAESGVELLVVPNANDREARADQHPPVCAVRRLSDLRDLTPTDPPSEATSTPAFPDGPDIRDLRGHAFPIRALEIAAAGSHSVLFRGAPGCGKTMLARRLPSILPPMSHEEAVEVTGLQSVAGNLRVDGLTKQRPFRAPHHSISASGLVGGHHSFIPGEVSLAHAGVLFLDELSEFSTRSLESLRQPLDDGEIALTKDQHTIILPARFQLVAATNPCPCGAANTANCRCSAAERKRYNTRLSGSLLDRFDMTCPVERPTPAEVEAGPFTDSKTLRARTSAAREIQLERYSDLPFVANGDLDGATTRRLLKPPDDVREMLNDGYKHHRISLRGYDRTLRIARTIADLDARDDISTADVAEALAFRIEPLI